MADAQPIPREPAETSVSLINPITCRNATFTSDAFMQNAIITIAEDGEKWAASRPGMQAYTTFNGGGAVPGNGLWFNNGFLWAASGGSLTRVASATSTGYSNATAYSSTSPGAWRGRRGGASVVFNGQIFVMGGTYDGVNQLSDVWSSPNGRDWVQVVAAAPWGVRQSFQAVVFNNRLYVMGGVNAGTFLNDVWVTDDGVTWGQVTSNAGWLPRSGFMAVVFNNGMWVMGGAGAGIGTDVWFTTDGANWVPMTGAAPWTARASGGLVALNDKMYLIGGSTGGREVWTSPDGFTWTQITTTAFSTARSQFACLVYNKTIYVICGFDVGFLQEVWQSFDGITWALATAAFGGGTRIQPMAVVFKAPPGISIIDAQTYYILGGQLGVGTYVDDVWYANLDGTLTTSYFITSDGTRADAATQNDNAYFCIKDLSTLNVFYQNQVQRITDPNYPPITVPGIVNLDETLYVMDPDGVIHGSTINNPFVWPSRNFIGADFLPDGGACIIRYNNYLLALGTKSLQLFYNSGAPGPTPLRPIKNSSSNVGCIWPYTAESISGTVMWVGNQETKGRQVYIMQGMQAQVVSTPFVEAILDGIPLSSIVTATAFQEAGHAYYILRLSSTLAIFYDLTTKAWGRWVDDTGTFNTDFCATDGANNYFLSNSFRLVLTSTTAFASDHNTNYVMRLQSPPVKNGSDCQKYCGRINVIGDRSNGTCKVSYSDDDYQTFSTPRVLTLNKDRVSDTRFGNYRRRAWRVDKDDGIPWRVKVLNTEIRVGNN